MTTRTTQTVVRFSSAFLLPRRRVAAFIHLPAIALRVPTQQMVPINSADLDAALEKDDQKS